MPVVIDPGKLTYLVQTPVGSFVATAPAFAAYNDLMHAWTTLNKQMFYVLPRRLNQATAYRARYDNAVKV